MPDFQFEKNLVLDYIKELDNAGPESIAEIINKYASPNFHLRCVHPFNDLIGAEKIASNFWTTIKNLLCRFNDVWIYFMRDLI